MISLSVARLPTRWRLALLARRLAACASLTTTSAAAVASIHTPTRPQWRTNGTAKRIPLGYRSASQVAHWQTKAALEAERAAAEERKKERVAAAKAAKRAARKDPDAVRLPDCEPFGPFEDIIQPVALTLWGGKALEKQNTPKLVYQAEFLGPTSFYRVRITVRKPETEVDIWRVLWLQTKPSFRESRRMRPTAQRAGKSAQKLVEEQEKSIMKRLGEKTQVPPLEAVVQDIFTRRLARLAYEKSRQPKLLEARKRNEPQRSTKKDGEELVSEKGEEKNQTPDFNITFQFQNPHLVRLPFKARTKMRHFDFCGPLPHYAVEERSSHELNKIWTSQGGNVLVNHFQLDKISRMSLGQGIGISMWRGLYDMEDMERFMTKSPLSTRAREIAEAEFKARAANQRGKPSKSIVIAAKERVKQLNLKSSILIKADGGWKKILNVVARERRTPPPQPESSGFLSFEKSPHPDRETIESVWNPRMAALRNPAALEDYDAFLRQRMEAGAVPDKVTDKDAREAEIKRGWQNLSKRKREHVAEIAKRERKQARELDGGDTEQQLDHAKPRPKSRERGTMARRELNQERQAAAQSQRKQTPAKEENQTPSLLVRRILAAESRDEAQGVWIQRDSKFTVQRQRSGSARRN